ncbi:MAG: PQQ-dependent sugar dehydrogenase [Anaerolineales bacterium]
MRRLIPIAILLTIASCSQPTSTPVPTIPESVPVTPTQIEPTLPSPTPTKSDFVDELPDSSTSHWAFVVGELVKPVDLQHAGDERLFVVDQRGLIWIFEGGEMLSEPFLDIQEWVSDTHHEQGLLGLAFHPNYVENGRLFVNYTDTFGNTVISRFEVSSERNLADRNSLRVILRVEQPYANHNGGGMAFGPDGHLFIAIGDGGSINDPESNGQNLDTNLGKLLRLDVDSADPYAIPTDNPYAAGGGLPEIWAYGLRNPWRFAFDQLTGDLYIGDVGQDDWEEINFQPSGTPGGVNYGWNIREGSHPFAGDTTEDLTDPVAEYDHNLGYSVIGGVVVRDPSLPEWQGVYLYGDYGSGRIWGLVRDAGGNWESAVLFETDFGISSFGQDVDGQIYLLDHTGVAIYRLERAP